MEAPYTTDYKSKYPGEDVVIDGELVSRLCRKCSQVKPIDMFQLREKETAVVWERVCRTCKSAHAKARYQNDPKYRASVLFEQRKKHAKKQGLPFTITIEQYLTGIESGYCARTGLPFDMSCDKDAPFAPSLDQIIPGNGYTPDNVQVVVMIYNLIKSNHSDADVLHMARALVAKHDQ